MVIVVGGVSQLYQGDLDLGRIAAERLAAEALGEDVLVEDLHYGAVAVAQRLEELAPEALILVGAEQGGGAPGSVRRRRITGGVLPVDQLHGAVADAVQGYVSIGLVVDVADGLGVLPRRTVTVEVEPVSVAPVPGLTAPAIAALEEALELVRAEVRRAPLLGLADQLRAMVAEDRSQQTTTSTALRDLLADLTTLDREGRWSRTFADRDRLRQSIAAGGGGDATRLDWALRWALIEELDRLQRLEVAETP